MDNTNDKEIKDTNTSTDVPNNFLSMPDEDILKMNDPSLVTAKPAVVVEETVEEVTEAKPVDAPEVKAETVKADDAALAAAKTETVEAIKPDTTDPVTKKEPEVKAEVPEVTIDYKAEYEKLMAPFKANGREIAPKSIDDVVALMQMGANYSKKMAALKPNLKIMKLLENNGLLNEDKISFLIDLDKKSPEAINKLVNDSGINPLEFDSDKASNYKPQVRTVDDREIDLDTVLDEIQGTPSYSRTLSVIGKEWDATSKQTIATTPQLIRVINDHIQNGIYDLIHSEIDRERMFGRLNGLSDIEAYRQVGDSMHSRGLFNHLSSPQTKTNPQPVEIVTPKPKADDGKLNEKRRAASTTKAVSSTILPKDFNPLSMSDDEFMKFAATHTM